MTDLLRRCGICRLYRAGLEKIIVSPSDPVIERIAAYPWPRGGVSVRKLRRGYTEFPSLKRCKYL